MIKSVSGIVNGVDVQTNLPMKKRTQIYVVDNNNQDMQVSAYEPDLQIALLYASRTRQLIRVEYDENDNNAVQLIELPTIIFKKLPSDTAGSFDEFLFSLARLIAVEKDVTTEETVDAQGATVRVRVLDR